MKERVNTLEGAFYLAVPGKMDPRLELGHMTPRFSFLSSGLGAGSAYPYLLQTGVGVFLQELGGTGFLQPTGS